ncbi:S-adenosyl-L-homocysteine hydrolase [Lactiplantibacillus pentosus]|nr:S-adenosyl-L-homocysteine hydrolase [Lactiplantibacillus pentosus]
MINSLDFIDYLCEHYEVYFIPKPKSIDRKVLKHLSKTCTILDVSRKELAGVDTPNLIKEIVGQDTFAIIDIGGYFVPRLSDIQKQFKGQLVKIIEDTENGYQKYEDKLSNNSISVPILSVARSSLKIEEDFLVGHEIVVKSEIFLADYGTTLLGKKVLVIGYGKVGSSIAGNLRKRGAIVIVADKMAIRLANALAHGYQITNDIYTELIDVDIVYIANGEKSIDTLQLKKLDLKHTLYSFSVTSADDTFKNSQMINKLPHYGHNGGYKILKTKSNRTVILANSGNAINFTYSISTLASYVQLTQAEMAVILQKDISGEENQGIVELNENDREKIAKEWLAEIFEVVKS